MQDDYKIPVNARYDQSLLKRVDDWRRRQPNIHARSEALRELARRSKELRLAFWKKGCGMTDILIGLQIKLARTIDVPCAACGETAVAICCSADPHIAALCCVCCQRHRGDLPKAVADFLVTAIN